MTVRPATSIFDAKHFRKAEYSGTILESLRENIAAGFLARIQKQGTFPAYPSSLFVYRQPS